MGQAFQTRRSTATPSTSLRSAPEEKSAASCVRIPTSVPTVLGTTVDARHLDKPGNVAESLAIGLQATPPTLASQVVACSTARLLAANAPPATTAIASVQCETLDRISFVNLSNLIE